mgnify:CR=1 FL=1
MGLLLGFELSTALTVFPITMITLLGCYQLLRKKGELLCDESSIASKRTYSTDNVNGSQWLLGLIIVFPVVMYFSWHFFWFFSVLFLSFLVFVAVKKYRVDAQLIQKKSTSFENLIVTLLIGGGVLFSYLISRSDLDDAFYAAVAAFASSNPTDAFKMGDPMLGEVGLPLTFPSYRFASFELLSGAGGYLFSVPAIDFYYIYLLPIWVVMSIMANFLLAKEYIPRYWLFTGCLTFVLVLLLGEMHRSPANFSFFRIFQGKAVFLSVLIPSIFYLTARFFSGKGTTADLFLLGCCQLASIGLTNFGMLMAPIAGFSALVSNALLVKYEAHKKIIFAFLVLLIPLPYLTIVAFESQFGEAVRSEVQFSSDIWLNVFGSHQQYLVGILLLLGPVLAKDYVTKARLAIPPLFLFAILLNPFLSEFISKYITTPPVYWRVTWSFPILFFAAVSLCMLIIELFDRRFNFLVKALLFLTILLAVIHALPFNTLRKENIGPFIGFAQWKIPPGHIKASKLTIKNVTDDGRILAPDEIAGVISRFENHPRLISTRVMYLNSLKPFFSQDEYNDRITLCDFVNGSVNTDQNLVREALRSLDVSVIVLNSTFENQYHLDVMHLEYDKVDTVGGYSIWVRKQKSGLAKIIQ